MATDIDNESDFETDYYQLYDLKTDGYYGYSRILRYNGIAYEFDVQINNDDMEIFINPVRNIYYLVIIMYFALIPLVAALLYFYGDDYKIYILVGGTIMILAVRYEFLNVRYSKWIFRKDRSATLYINDTEMSNIDYVKEVLYYRKSVSEMNGSRKYYSLIIETNKSTHHPMHYLPDRNYSDKIEILKKINNYLQGKEM